MCRKIQSAKNSRIFHNVERKKVVGGCIVISHLTKLVVLPKQLQNGCVINFEPSETLLRDILEKSKDTIAIVNNSGQFLYLSPSFEKALGFPIEELMKMSVFDLAHPDDIDKVVAAYRDNYRRGKHEKIEYRYRHVDGHYIWFENTGQLLFDEEGQVRGVILFGRDITDRKKSEDALRESEIRFRSIFNNASVGIALVNREGFVKTINDAFCSFLGCCQKEIIGNSISAYVNEEDLDIDMHMRGALLKTKRSSYVIEKRFRRKDGETVWGRLNVSMIRETQGSCPCLVVVCEDITSLKAKENELQALQSIYEAMLGALEEVSVSSVRHQDEMRTLADLGICLQSVGYEVVVAGSALEVVCELMGAQGIYYSYDESTGSLALISLMGIPETEQVCTSEISSFKVGEDRGLVGKAAENRESIYVPDVLTEPNWITADLNVGIRSVYIIPLYYGEKLFGVLSIISQYVDGFSREKQALADSVASYISAAMENTRLFAETKQAYEKLNTTQQQLLQSQKMEAIGQLAGGMAHDINNQLTVIQACVDLCLPRLEEEYLSNIFNKIRTAAERSANLTRQLMIFGRKQPQFKTTIDLNHNIEQIQDVLERMIGDDVKIYLDLEPDLHVINADPTNINQVIINLALNGRDAMPDGGQLIIKTRNIKIDQLECLNLPEQGHRSLCKYICLSVADTGKGIDEQIKTHLFEPFFTTKDTYNGTGLGLSVVYGIVKSHEGWINVKSQPDNGSIFEIFLPALDQEVEDISNDGNDTIN